MFDEQRPSARGASTQNPEPHRDVDTNVKSFYRQMSYVQWLTNHVSYDISDRTYTHMTEPDGKKVSVAQVKEYKNVVFTYREGPAEMSFCISFHQPNQEFQKQLCGALNRLGGKGFLEHKLRHPDGSFKSKAEQAYKRDESQWEKLFG